MKRASHSFLLTSILFLALYIVFPGLTYRADVRIGYIDTKRVFSEFTKFQEAAKKVEEERVQLQKDFELKQDEYDKIKTDYESKSLLWSDEKKEETQTELERLSKDIRDFSAKNFAQDGTLYKRYNDIHKPILAEVQSVIDKLCFDEGFDIVFDTQNGSILYGKEDFDLTDLLLEKLEDIK